MQFFGVDKNSDTLDVFVFGILHPWFSCDCVGISFKSCIPSVLMTFTAQQINVSIVDDRHKVQTKAKQSTHTHIRASQEINRLTLSIK